MLRFSPYWRQVSLKDVHHALWISRTKPLQSSNSVSVARPITFGQGQLFTSSDHHLINHPLPLFQCQIHRPSRLSTFPHIQALDEDDPVEETSSTLQRERQPPLKCAGCGIILQAKNANSPGFIPEDHLKNWVAQETPQPPISVNESSNSLDEKERVKLPTEPLDQSVGPVDRPSQPLDQPMDPVDRPSQPLDQPMDPMYRPSQPLDQPMDPVDRPSQPLICRRCFSLKHYNTALNITLKTTDYLTHLSSLKEKRALILLMVDVTDFPTSVFPNLNSLVSPESQVLIVANKIDLLPKGTTGSFWRYFESMITSEVTRSSLLDCREVMGVQFVSAKTGDGVEGLSNKIISSWGNRGDVYLLGCTNVGKSSLFNRLLSLLCGSQPGQLNTASDLSAPMATISQWPGTTLGLLSFPLLSVGKIKRLRYQKKEMEKKHHLQDFNPDEEFEQIAADQETIVTPRESKRVEPDASASTEVEDVLEEAGVKRRRRDRSSQQNAAPQNRFWLHDTPGAINDAQLINLLTTKELKLALPKKPIIPRTFILKPEQSMLIGGLARLDYVEGPVSAYFTVYAASYLPVHTTKMMKADKVYQTNIGTALLKIPVDGPDRQLESFPALLSQDLTLCGLDWKQSVADIVLSSAGWVSFTIGAGMEANLRAYTPSGKGIFIRTPSLFPTAINERGKRSQTGNRTAFKGK